MINNLLSRLRLAYNKGKDNVGLKEQKELEARAFGIAMIGLGQSISTNPDSKNSVNEDSKRIYEGYNKNHKETTEKIKENQRFPTNYLEKLVFNLGYFLGF